MSAQKQSLGALVTVRPLHSWLHLVGRPRLPERDRRLPRSLMKDEVTFTGRQIAAARELIGIDQKVLAEAAGISAPTLREWNSPRAFQAG
jgi:hypothetical protein